MYRLGKRLFVAIVVVTLTTFIYSGLSQLFFDSISRRAGHQAALKSLAFLWNDLKKETNLTSAAESNPDDVYVELGSSKVQRLLDFQVNCSSPWMTFDNGGRLGNQICPLFFLYYLRYTYDAQVGLSPKVWNLIKDIFPHLHFKLLPDKCLQRIGQLSKRSKGDIMHHFKVHNGLKNSIYMYDSNCRVGDVYPLRKVLINEFRFSDSILKEASKRLEGLMVQWRNKHTMETVSPILVGVHIRRSDYVNFLKIRANTTLPTPDYFQQAFTRAREMFGVVAFMVVSTDIKWCQEYVVSRNDDAVISSSPSSSTVDMATLTLCDHVITTVGTFGDSAAILAGGKIFYPYRNFTTGEKMYGIQYFKDQLDKYPDFIPVSYNPSEI